MSPERHGRVWEYGFGPIPTLAFGSTSRRQLVGALATQLENAQELLAAAEQKFANAIGELSHVKETFEERLIKVQKKDTRRSERRVWRKNFKNRWSKWCNNFNQGNRILEIMLHLHMIDSPIFCFLWLLYMWCLVGWLFTLC